MNSYIVALLALVAVSSASASHLLAPAGPFLPAPLAAPIAAPIAGPFLHAPLAAPALLAPAPILTAPAVIGHHPVVVGHAPVATSTHIAAPIASQILSRPVATYSTTHTLLGAPLAAPALLARPAFAAPYPAPLAAPALLARPALCSIIEQDNE